MRPLDVFYAFFYALTSFARAFKFKMAFLREERKSARWHAEYEKKKAARDLAWSLLTPPWITLEEHLEEMNTSVEEFMKQTGLHPGEMEEIREGRVITPEMAEKIASFWEEKHHENMKRFWLNLDAQHQEELRKLCEE